jgi:hypothetical protein
MVPKNKSKKGVKKLGKTSKITKRERKLTKKLVEFQFENVDSFLELLEEGSYVFYHSLGMSSECSVGSIDFKYEFESNNGTIIVYSHKFRKNHKNKEACGDDIMLKLMEKYPKINFVPGIIKIK